MKRARARTKTDHRKLPRPGGRTAHTTTAVLDTAFRLLVAKGLQNLSIADVAAQSSAYRATWKRYRWVLFAIGVVFASILTRFFAAKIFGYAA